MLSFHIVADTIPEAFYRAVDLIWNKGTHIRTQYDRKDQSGAFIDPPSREATVCIEINNPFSEPRHPAVAWSETGKYIAELMGAKDHLVIPYCELTEFVKRDEHVGEAKRWPYTYSQRLRAYPLQDGRCVNQIEKAIERIVEDHTTRRAVMTTRVPEVDCFLDDDIPCLGEIHLRCPKEDDHYVLHMRTYWRSRDLYKAWCDNVIAITFLQQQIAQQIEKRSGVRTKVGRYIDTSTSLHIYGQDKEHIEGKEGKSKAFFERHDLEKFLAMSMKSDFVGESLIVPQLKDLLKEEEIWKFTDVSREIINDLIEGISSGSYTA